MNAPGPNQNAYEYLTGRDGHYLYKLNQVFEALVKTDNHPSHQPLAPSFRLVAPRLPWTLIETAVTFLRAVHTKYGTEALLLLSYNALEGWTLHVPQQRVGAVRVEYENDQNVRVVGSIHSHPGMRPHPSSTDEHDEVQFDGIHLIIDPLACLDQCMTVTACVNGHRFPLDPENAIADLPTLRDDAPEEWLAKVTPTKTPNASAPREHQNALPFFLPEDASWFEDEGTP